MDYVKDMEADLMAAKKTEYLLHIQGVIKKSLTM